MSRPGPAAGVERTMNGRPPRRYIAYTLACGKHVHASRADAKAAVKRLRGMGKSDESCRPLVAYRCGPCDGWHVGHRPQRSGHIDAT